MYDIYGKLKENMDLLHARLHSCFGFIDRNDNSRHQTEAFSIILLLNRMRLAPLLLRIGRVDAVIRFNDLLLLYWLFAL